MGQETVKLSTEEIEILEAIAARYSIPKHRLLKNAVLLALNYPKITEITARISFYPARNPRKSQGG